MPLTAEARGFQPECVLFDSWYASVDNLRLIRDRGWRWLTQLKAWSYPGSVGQLQRGGI